MCVHHVRPAARDAVAAPGAGLGDPGPRGGGIEGPEAFENWLGELSEIDWVIRLRSVWDRSGPQDLEAANKTVEYLARYANRVAISNSRLVAIQGDQVLFSYKDYRDGGQWKTTELHGVEFIGRFDQIARGAFGITLEKAIGP